MSDTELGSLDVKERPTLKKMFFVGLLLVGLGIAAIGVAVYYDLSTTRSGKKAVKHAARSIQTGASWNARRFEQAQSSTSRRRRGSRRAVMALWPSKI